MDSTEFPPPPLSPLVTLLQSPVLRMAEGDTVYDYCWYPKMNSLDPDTCLWVLLAVCQAAPWASGLNNWIHETFKVHFKGQPARWWKTNIHRISAMSFYQAWCQSVICVFNLDLGWLCSVWVSSWAFLIDDLNIEDTAARSWLIWSLWYLLSSWEPAAVPVLRICKKLCDVSHYGEELAFILSAAASAAVCSAVEAHDAFQHDSTN